MDNIATFIVLILVFFASFVGGVVVTITEIEKRSIEKEECYYDTKTGKLQYKNEIFKYIITGKN